MHESRPAGATQTPTPAMTHVPRFAACSALALLATLACKDDMPQDPNPATATFAPALGVDVATMQKSASGLLVQEVAKGSGPAAKPGSTVSVHYSGYLADGDKFDSSRDRNEPISFELGRGQVIEGWDEGIAGMQVGGKRKLVIPPSLGYGSRGAGGVIPPNAILVFDVELTGVR
jgi:FKBP-type peptidyl-prolyl cis-trans isomerase FkpA